MNIDRIRNEAARLLEKEDKSCANYQDKDYCTLLKMECGVRQKRLCRLYRRQEKW